MSGMMAAPGFIEAIEASNPQLRTMLDSAPGMRDMCVEGVRARTREDLFLARLRVYLAPSSSLPPRLACRRMRNPAIMRAMLSNPAVAQMAAAQQAGGGGMGMGMGGLGLGGGGGGGGLAALSDPRVAAMLAAMGGGTGAPGSPSNGAPAVPAQPGGAAPAGGAAPDFAAMMQMMAAMRGGGGGGGGVGMPGVPARPPEELYTTQLAQMAELGFVNRELNIRALQRTGGNVEAAINRVMDGAD